MTERGQGILAMIGTCVIWGLSPMFYAQVAHQPPLDILAHRTIWSLLFFLALLGVQGRLRALADLRAAWPRLALAGLFISGNWFLFILATQIGRVTESSLGYYIFPLVAVMLGRLVLGEHLSWPQWLAVALAAAAVSMLAAGLGAAPWLSLALAGTFAGYGLIKRTLAAGPVVTVTAEVALLTPLALGWLWFAAAPVEDGRTLGFLLASGPLTAVPLALFSFAARRVRLSTLGLVQYLNPTLQFCCAVLFFAEPVTRWHALAFPAIWVALAIYSADSLRRDRSARRQLMSASTPATRVM